ncbi:MAG: crossover junction endodeoxyribonuclease RuvC [Nitrospinota bacterium]
MRVLGIDPGSSVTGFGVVDDNGERLTAIEWGGIRTSSNQSFPKRLKTISCGLEEIIQRHRPDIAAIEGLFFAKNASSALKLGEVRGVTILTASNLGLEVVEYSPLEVKQSVVGYGRADKRQVQDMVVALLKLTETPRPNDAADALAIAICHIHSALMKKRLML